MGQARKRRLSERQVEGMSEGQVELTSSGQNFNPSDRPFNEPVDKPGQHLWQVFVTYNVTAEQAATAYVGVETVNMDMENISFMAVGCIKCEQPFNLTIKNTMCTGSMKA
jgi:hypothetical protein